MTNNTGTPENSNKKLELSPDELHDMATDCLVAASRLTDLATDLLADEAFTRDRKRGKTDAASMARVISDVAQELLGIDGVSAEPLTTP